MESGVVALAMMDYWLSFAVSGTPNDGKGLPSTLRYMQPTPAPADWTMDRQGLLGLNIHPTTKYVSFCLKTQRPLTPDKLLQVLIQFDTTELTSNLSEATFTVIPDNYRAQQISFVNSVAPDLGE